ncbi:MAG: hypothetical protein CMI57_00370 [Parcubacteria group bacterium]|jgi:hypothetical protein|nr:hypothetical protein [Parcubacteria group bacterium]
MPFKKSIKRLLGKLFHLHECAFLFENIEGMLRSASFFQWTHLFSQSMKQLQANQLYWAAMVFGELQDRVDESRKVDRQNHYVKEGFSH